ncbi:unnamed protein product [Caretta caretta]
MTESDILQKLTTAATKKQPGVKPIKGISGVNVKDFHPPEMTPTFLPGTGLFLAVVTCITIAGKRTGDNYGKALRALSLSQELLVKGFLVNIIEAAYVPAINGALHEGIPLPNLLGIKYEHADIHVSEVPQPRC